MSDKCKCAEMLDKTGRRIEIGHERYHDCGYVRKRAALIGKAETAVIERHGYNLPGPRFTRLFAQEMEQLAREKKLI